MTAHRRPAAALAALLAILAAGCGTGPATSDGPSVAATTTQLGDLARAVAGSRATVRQILEPSSDPHAYEPRPSDVKAVGAASVVVRSGGELDGWLGDVLRNAGTDARTATILDDLPVVRRDGDRIDPHWWQDPRNAEIALRKIRDLLVEADPAGRTTYDANAARYLARLYALDRAIARCMRAIPARERKLVTDHDALGYYADRYGIEVVGTVIPASSTQAQASAGEVVRLARTIRAEGVSTVFPESSVNPKLTRAIAREAGARTGPALYADSLGAKGSAGATYLGALRANTLALVAGFTDGRARCALPG